MWHKYILAAFILLLFPKLLEESHSLNAAKVNKGDANLFSRNPEVFFSGWFKPRKSLLLISSPDFSFVQFGGLEVEGWPHNTAWVPEERTWRELPSSFPWDPLVGCLGMAWDAWERIYLGRFLRLGSQFILMTVWSNAVIGLLELYMMPQISHCLISIWTMFLITCITFWSVLKWPGSCTGWWLTRPFQLKYSVLMYSVLRCSVLFFSELYWKFMLTPFCHKYILREVPSS